MELPLAKDLPPYYIVVKFGSGVPSEHQSRVMFAMEKWLRESGIPVEVFKETMPDDSKLRRNMTKEQRDKL